MVWWATLMGAGEGTDAPAVLLTRFPRPFLFPGLRSRRRDFCPKNVCNTGSARRAPKFSGNSESGWLFGCL
jgi:hypothetical protein